MLEPNSSQVGGSTTSDGTDVGVFSTRDVGVGIVIKLDIATIIREVSLIQRDVHHIVRMLRGQSCLVLR